MVGIFGFTCDRLTDQMSPAQVKLEGERPIRGGRGACLARGGPCSQECDGKVEITRVTISARDPRGLIVPVGRVRPVASSPGSAR